MMITVTFKTLSGKVGRLSYNQKRVTLKRIVRDYNQSKDLFDSTSMERRTSGLMVCRIHYTFSTK